MTQRAKQLSRRKFLFVAGAGGAVTAAAVVAKNAAQVVPPTRGNGDKRATRGYQASEHVNHYYRTAKV